MQLKKIFLIFILSVGCYFQLIAQASWDYTMYFNLVDSNGEQITSKSFKDKNLKVFSMPMGAHVDNALKYNETLDCFEFSQHTITGSNILVLTDQNDTLILRIPTRHFYLDKIEFHTGFYDIKHYAPSTEIDTKTLINLESYLVLKEANPYLPAVNQSLINPIKSKGITLTEYSREPIPFESLVEVKFK